MNERYQQREHAKWLAKILFIKHFLYEQMEQIQMGKSLPESLLLTYNGEIFDVETLIGRYQTHIYSKNECIQIVEDSVNNPVIWIFAVLQYDFGIPQADRSDPRWFANESDHVMKRMEIWMPQHRAIGELFANVLMPIQIIIRQSLLLL